jgi:hypothetical protein
MTIKLIAAMLMGSITLALGQVVPPALEVEEEAETSVTLKLTAGSEPIVGFDIYYWIPNHGFFLTQFCDSYVLQPGETRAFSIGVRAKQGCRFDWYPRPLYCGRTYYFAAFPHNQPGTVSNVADGRTLECGP